MQNSRLEIIPLCSYRKYSHPPRRATEFRGRRGGGGGEGREGREGGPKEGNFRAGGGVAYRGFFLGRLSKIIYYYHTQ